MSNTLTIHLKQHTPIIHFQHMQPGATLRATEVKPKLDRFIIEKITGIKDQKLADQEMVKNHKNWLIGKGEAEHVALDYKLSFASSNAVDYYIEKPSKKNGVFEIKKNGETKTTPEPLFFGNMGKDYNKIETIKKFEYALDGVEMKIFSVNSEIINEIDKHLPEFLATHNFGTRKSKGFGKFYFNESKHPEEKNRLLNQKRFFDYQFSIKLENEDFNGLDNLRGHEAEIHLVNERINWFYKTLRSGINEVKLKVDDKRKPVYDEFGLQEVETRFFYFKSLLFHYFRTLEPPIQWEKKTIKQKFFNGVFVKQSNRLRNSDVLNFSVDEEKQKLLTKDLLGLSSEEAWLSYNNTKITKVQADGKGKELNKEDITIHRYASPIKFHVFKIQDREYLVFIKFDLRHNLLNQEFIIKSGGDFFPIKTPDSFSLADFFTKTVLSVTTNFSDFAGNEPIQPRGKKIYQALKKIYVNNFQKVNP